MQLRNGIRWWIQGLGDPSLQNFVISKNHVHPRIGVPKNQPHECWSLKHLKTVLKTDPLNQLTLRQPEGHQLGQAFDLVGEQAPSFAKASNFLPPPQKKKHGEQKNWVVFF